MHSPIQYYLSAWGLAMHVVVYVVVQRYRMQAAVHAQNGNCPFRHQWKSAEANRIRS